jgi:hypothetical protein
VQQLLARLDAYENLSSVAELSDDDLFTLEGKLLASVDKIKSEKARRIYKEEISSLKLKLGL